LFDAAAYEQKEAVRSIIKGSSDVLSYRFGTNFNDTAYSSCHVTYTDPATGKTIEYTYKPKKTEGSGQVLEVNEKVTSKEEARQLAIKRLRQKNKAEFTAEFSLVGDLDLVAGVTVMVSGYGMFDGKYIIETATHQLTGGYTVSLKLRRVLEGY
jgi:phage protein D